MTGRDELRRLSDAATPGNWFEVPRGDERGSQPTEEDEDFASACVNFVRDHVLAGSVVTDAAVEAALAAKTPYGRVRDDIITTVPGGRRSVAMMRAALEAAAPFMSAALPAAPREADPDMYPSAEKRVRACHEAILDYAGFDDDGEFSDNLLKDLRALAALPAAPAPVVVTEEMVEVACRKQHAYGHGIDFDTWPEGSYKRDKRDIMRHVLEAALQSAPGAGQAGWRPIETAPKSNERRVVYILITDGICVPDVVTWRPVRPAYVDKWGTGHTERPEGWFCVNGGRSRITAPLYWRDAELPTPPAQTEGGA